MSSCFPFPLWIAVAFEIGRSVLQFLCTNVVTFVTQRRVISCTSYLLVLEFWNTVTELAFIMSAGRVFGAPLGTLLTSVVVAFVLFRCFLFADSFRGACADKLVKLDAEKHHELANFPVPFFVRQAIRLITREGNDPVRLLKEFADRTRA